MNLQEGCGSGDDHGMSRLCWSTDRRGGGTCANLRELVSELTAEPWQRAQRHCEPYGCCAIVMSNGQASAEVVFVSWATRGWRVEGGGSGSSKAKRRGARSSLSAARDSGCASGRGSPLGRSFGRAVDKPISSRRQKSCSSQTRFFASCVVLFVLRRESLRPQKHNAVDYAVPEAQGAHP